MIDVVVLGAPRSGTSMTAGLLDLLGVDLGDVREGDAENPTGYFEDRGLMNLQEDIFNAADEESHGFRPPSQEQLESVKTEFEGRIRKLIQDRHDHSESVLIGWKLPTLVYTVDWFLPHLKNPHLVSVFRNPLSNAESIQEYTKNREMYKDLSREEALSLAHGYQQVLLQFLRKNKHLPQTAVAFEEIRRKPVEEVKNLGEILGKSIDEELKTKAKHFVKSAQEMEMKKKKEKREKFVQSLLHNVIHYMKAPIRWVRDSGEKQNSSKDEAD